MAEALKTLLPILDSLDRALKTKAASVEDFRSGIELIDKQFHDALAKVGVEPIPAEGQAFDPNFHQAVQMVETSETEDNHVIDELQRGYKLKDRLLRPAMVRVARNRSSVVLKGQALAGSGRFVDAASAAEVVPEGRVMIAQHGGHLLAGMLGRRFYRF